MKLRSSVFAKLFLILVTTGVAINFILFQSMHYIVVPRTETRFFMERTHRHYAQYIVNELSAKPTLENALKITEENGVGIRVEGALNWTTSESIPNYETAREMQKREIERGRGIGGAGSGPLPPPRLGPPKKHTHVFLVTERILPQGLVKFVVVGPPMPDFEINYAWFFLLILAVTTVLAVGYFMIRRLLSPLRGLSEGVNEIARGNLSYSVPVKGSDELARLGTSFNRMTGQIREMMRAKEQLLLDVSHELRTPLTRAKLALEFVTEGAARNDLNDEILEMDHMINEILEGARLDSAHGSLALAEADLGELIAEVVKRYDNKSPRVEYQKSAAPSAVRIDRERIRTVLKNLIENAMKYSPADRTVRVKAERKEDEVIICVEDQGIGIPATEIERVFEPFYRVDKSRTRNTGGFGLGLNLCRKIIAAHGGSITLSSREGAGTTVMVSLPLYR